MCAILFVAALEHEQMLERRFAMSDALGELSVDEMLLLELEVLGEYPTELSRSAVESCLTTLAMRVGKMFSPEEVDGLIQRLMPRAGAKVSPAELLVALNAARAAAR